MPRRITDWEVTEAFSKFGFEDGGGPDFTDEVVSAIEAAGLHRCRTQVWGLHNYGIGLIEAHRNGELKGTDEESTKSGRTKGAPWRSLE